MKHRLLTLLLMLSLCMVMPIWTTGCADISTVLIKDSSGQVVREVTVENCKNAKVHIEADGVICTVDKKPVPKPPSNGLIGWIPRIFFGNAKGMAEQGVVE